MTQTRADLRKELRSRRRQMDAQAQLQASDAIAARLGRSHLFNHSRRIAGYIANEGEPDLSHLMQLAWQRKKQWYLPIIGRPNLNQLWFANYRQGEPLVYNRYGIPEPDQHLHQTPPPWGLDLILMPLVAFDDQGNRLGMGKGYYDRTLQFLHRRRHWRKPRLVGVAYEFQKVVQLPHQPWDIPLDAVITEQQLYTIGRQPR